ncbi:substrate-binding domain-containing protein [Aquibium oceanicum]|nr:substrate-binding domain-containing protein [Aquibium oceanicum]
MIQRSMLRHGAGGRGYTPLSGFDVPDWSYFRGAGRNRIAVMVPMSGSAGIWGPSCISCAQLAADEINRHRGIGDREVELVFLDADDSVVDSAVETIAGLVDDGGVSAVVGMHVSSVRQRLNEVLRGRIPYVYTPLYEGNERAPGCFAIGETPAEQLAPAIRRLAETLKVRRWALVGNDYVWPRASHRFAKDRIAEAGGQVVFETYVPFGIEEPVELVERVAAAKPDIVLLSLIGQEAVEFNRVFGAMRLDRSIVRFSTAIEENVLLATGADGTRRLYAASAYFASLRSDANLSFVERYRTLHGERAPVLNALGQSIYEGMHFYSALRDGKRARRAPIVYRSARGGTYFDNERKANPIYLARADEHLFSVIERLV